MMQKPYIGMGVLGVLVTNVLHEGRLIPQRFEVGAHELIKSGIEHHKAGTRGRVNIHTAKHKRVELANLLRTWP